MNKPDKTLKVGGQAQVTVNGETLTIVPQNGLIAVSIADTSGIVMWMHHPLSGWYVEADMRRDNTDGSEAS